MKAGIVSLVAGGVGLVVSLVLAARHAQVRVGEVLCREGSGGVVGGLGGCDAVMASRWGTLMGVPTAHWGVVFYAAVVGLLLVTVAMRGARGLRALVVGVAGVGVGVSLVLVGAQVLSVRAICPLCMTSAACAVVLFLGAVAMRRRGEWAGYPRTAGVAGGVLVAGLAWGVVAALGAERGGNGDAEVLARFDGREVRGADMRRDVPEEAEGLERGAYAVKVGYARRKLAGLAIDAEAKARGLTREALIRAEVDEKLADERKRAEETAAGISPDDEGRRGRIAANMLADARTARLNAWIEELLTKHKWEIVVPPPLGREVTLDESLAVTMGRADARLQLTVYSDLQCPICARLDAELEALRGRFGADLAIRFRHFPLKDHEFAEDAAVVGELVAREKGVEAFWAYKEALYARGGDLDAGVIEAAAVEQGVPAEAVAAGRKDETLIGRVKRSAAEARANKLDGAPVMILNGRVIGGLMEEGELERRLAAALK